MASVFLLFCHAVDMFMQDQVSLLRTTEVKVTKCFQLNFQLIYLKLRLLGSKLERLANEAGALTSYTTYQCPILSITNNITTMHYHS